MQLSATVQDVPRKADEVRPHRISVPLNEAQRRALGLAAADRLVSVAELARAILDYGLKHLDEIDDARKSS